MPHPYATYTGQQSAGYIAAPQTAEIINLAIHLGRPLLVEGEAGCGKTRLAGAIAEELGLGEVIAVTVKSTSQAKDLLYRFDALRRLQDAQDRTNTRAHHIHPYISLEPLGRAIQQGRPGVVLIDEVDKADIDFPNDLLDVLDRFEFDIEDLPVDESAACSAERGFGRHVSGPPGGTRPIVLITSNREKQLPEPFLRRCLYVQLDFPTDPAMLAEIVRRNLATQVDALSDTLIAGAVARFCEIRQRAHDLKLQKLPATSELVDWVRVLHWKGRRAEDIRPDELAASDQALLFKIRDDIRRYGARSSDEAGR
ncbi:AAA family ATPase [Zoogloea sp.]|uniref:AAA family ATPase n=1 Tax=Zoogloea sp. TaxID=49181 RepID=UPI0035B32248